MPDRLRQLEYLDRVERVIVTGEMALTRQAHLIAKLHAAGRDAHAAERQLTEFEQTMEVWLQQRSFLLAAMSWF